MAPPELGEQTKMNKGPLATVAAMANPTLRPAAHVLQRKCACGQHTIAGGECEECKNDKMQLQRSSAGIHGLSTALPIVHEVLRSPGQPLDQSARAFMEPRFGRDFSHVRVHTDSRAAESAESINALAYTVGSNIVFGSGQYAPQRQKSKHLLAHELTHVAQQANGTISADAESRANASADQILRGKPVNRNSLGGAPVSLQRQEKHGEIGHEEEPILPSLLHTFEHSDAFKKKPTNLFEPWWLHMPTQQPGTKTYTVKKGETLTRIAAKFGISVEDLKKTNEKMLKKWPASNTGGPRKGPHFIWGFNAGDQITIPPVRGTGQLPKQGDDVEQLRIRTSSLVSTPVEMKAFMTLKPIPPIPPKKPGLSFGVSGGAEIEHWLPISLYGSASLEYGGFVRSVSNRGQWPAALKHVKWIGNPGIGFQGKGIHKDLYQLDAQAAWKWVQFSFQPVKIRWLEKVDVSFMSGLSYTKLFNERFKGTNLFAQSGVELELTTKWFPDISLAFDGTISWQGWIHQGLAKQDLTRQATLELRIKF